MMRPLVIHLADDAMVEGLRGFFSRPQWHFALGCAPFELAPESARDFLKIPGATDQAVWKFAHEHLAPFKETHERSLIVLDEHFDPWPGAPTIEADITERMLQSGWERDRFQVIVIRPMLEAWLWMESDAIARAFGVDRFDALKARLITDGLWREGERKPHALKEAARRAAQLGKTKSNRKTFGKVFAQASSRALDQCIEPGFQQMRQTLQTWFPQEGGAA